MTKPTPIFIIDKNLRRLDDNAELFADRVERLKAIFSKRKKRAQKMLDCKICVHGLTRLTRQIIIVSVEFRLFAEVSKF